MKKPAPSPLTPAVFHILLALADGPLHGYGIMQAVEGSAAGEPAMGPGTIYGSLQKMVDEGLISEQEERPEEGDDERRRYSRITERGRSVASAEAQRLADLVAVARAQRLLPSEQG